MQAKRFKNEKYLYLLLGYTMATTTGGRYDVGGEKGRSFEVERKDGYNLLFEYKSPRKGTGDERRKVYQVTNINSRAPEIREYIKDGVNYGAKWDVTYPLSDYIDSMAVPADLPPDE